jgi:hypothetical protein
VADHTPCLCFSHSSSSSVILNEAPFSGVKDLLFALLPDRRRSDRDVWYTEVCAILATMIARIRAVDGGSGTACAGPVIGI